MPFDAHMFIEAWICRVSAPVLAVNAGDRVDRSPIPCQVLIGMRSRRRPAAHGGATSPTEPQMNRHRVQRRLRNASGMVSNERHAIH